MVSQTNQEEFMKYLIFVMAFMPVVSFSAEGILCRMGYESVQRAVNNMNSSGQVSLLAKAEVYRELKQKLGYCLTDCEGKKFKYCDSVAKDFESNK
jgi:hypothetical protein